MKFAVEIDNAGAERLEDKGDHALLGILREVVEQVEKAVGYDPGIETGPIFDAEKILVGRWAYVPHS